MTLPHELAEAVAGYKWQQVFTGCTSTQVFRLQSAAAESLYLKILARDFERLLEQEKLRLEWLQGLLPVPQVRLFAEDEDKDYLLISEIAGVAASEDLYKRDTTAVIEQLATGLRMIHSLPFDGCPFDWTLQRKVERARQRMVRGLIEESNFDEPGEPSELFQKVVERLPVEEELVFTHGDYCLPNIILRDWKLGGFVDWGEAGIADRYQDIALLARSIAENFGSQWVPLVYEKYGIEPDHAKLEFYMLLDEFF